MFFFITFIISYLFQRHFVFLYVDPCYETFKKNFWLIKNKMCSFFIWLIFPKHFRYVVFFSINVFHTRLFFKRSFWFRTHQFQNVVSRELDYKRFVSKNRFFTKVLTLHLVVTFRTCIVHQTHLFCCLVTPRPFISSIMKTRYMELENFYSNVFFFDLDSAYW